MVMRSSLGLSRQPALSPRQPRGGSGGERWRGGGQPQGCRSHHEQCLLCAHSPVLSGADPQNWPGDWISLLALTSRAARFDRALSPFELVSRKGAFRPAEKSPVGAEKSRLQRPRTGAGISAGDQGLARKPLNPRAQSTSRRKGRFCKGAWLRTQSGANRSPDQVPCYAGKYREFGTVPA